MSNIDYDKELDVKGESCPMPVVKTKQEVDSLDQNEVLRVLSTDSGSLSDINGWSKGMDNIELIEQESEDDELYVHYLKKE